MSADRRHVLELEQEHGIPNSSSFLLESADDPHVRGIWTKIIASMAQIPVARVLMAKVTFCSHHFLISEKRSNTKVLCSRIIL